MKHSLVGRSGVRVSSVCLRTATFCTGETELLDTLIALPTETKASFHHCAGDRAESHVRDLIELRVLFHQA